MYLELEKSQRKSPVLEVQSLTNWGPWTNGQRLMILKQPEVNLRSNRGCGKKEHMMCTNILQDGSILMVIHFSVILCCCCVILECGKHFRTLIIMFLISFNACDNDEFKQMCEATGQFGPGLEPPCQDSL